MAGAKRGRNQLVLDDPEHDVNDDDGGVAAPRRGRRARLEESDEEGVWVGACLSWCLQGAMPASHDCSFG